MTDQPRYTPEDFAHASLDGYIAALRAHRGMVSSWGH